MTKARVALSVRDGWSVLDLQFDEDPSIAFRTSPARLAIAGLPEQQQDSSFGF